MYEVTKTLPGGRAIVKGEYRDLNIDDNVVVSLGGKSYSAVVETRIFGGAVVRVILER